MKEIEQIKEIIKYATLDALPEAIEQYVIKVSIEEFIDGWDSCLHYMAGKKEYGVIFDTAKKKLAELKKGINEK